MPTLPISREAAAYHVSSQAAVGSTRVMPAEMDALFDQLEGWLENASFAQPKRIAC